MNRKKCVIIICSLLGVAALVICACVAWKYISSAGDDRALKWTIIGAMGSWAGSVFGAIALLISLFALWLPQKVKIKVEVRNAMMMSQIPEVGKIDAYSITVKNTGVRPVTINNVYLNFGGRKMGDIFVGMLNMGSPLQIFTPQFPKRLEQGESFDYHLLKDKLDAALAYYEEKTPLDTPLYIRVNEVTKGNIYAKTKWTLGTFIRHTIKTERKKGN